jgi:hypothetical protein
MRFKKGNLVRKDRTKEEVFDVQIYAERWIDADGLCGRASWRDDGGAVSCAVTSPAWIDLATITVDLSDGEQLEVWEGDLA